MTAAAVVSSTVLTDLPPLARLDLRAAGPAAPLDPEFRALARGGAVPDAAVRAGARDILASIERDGATAVRDANTRFGGGQPDGSLVIPGRDLAVAASELPLPVRDALETAIANVRRFAESQRPLDRTTAIAPGVEIERRWVPVGRVGAYIPGGGAAYPSSVVMTVVPARVAGVGGVTIATPAGGGGVVDPTLLGAAGLLAVDSIVVAGGAQAIGALAFGLPGLGIEPADLVVGPGNAWVTAAKLELAGRIAIDMPAGPSEGLVLATPPADPDRVAADLLTQAEHGPDSPAILITTDAAFADLVETAMRRRVASAPRSVVLTEALGRHGRIILVSDMGTAIAVVNAYAPEHLSIDVPELEAVVAQVRNAGSVFVGPWAPESAGDYATGANHVLPTGGLARGCGALAVETFGKYLQVQRISRDGLAGLRPAIETLAVAEGLFAHRDAVAVRFPEARDDEATTTSPASTAGAGSVSA